MVDLLETKITLDQYVDQFWEIENQIQETRKKVMSDFETLKKFEPNSES